MLSQPTSAPASGSRTRGGDKVAVVGQIVDISAAQQDVSRDFVVGSRAAWQDAAARGGLGGRSVQHLTLEVDGSAASLQAAWARLEQDSACVAVCGCVGHPASQALLALQARSDAKTPLPIVAPWMHQAPTQHPVDAVFDIFATHEAQVLHALRGLSSMGVRQFGVAYASAMARQATQDQVLAAAKALQLTVQAVTPESTPPIVLFVGGTPELHAFVQQLRLPPGRQCYVVALADVNLQVFAQLGGVPKSASVIATQPVPMTTAGVPIVRAYRETLSRLYDEPPSPQGLAGFIAARYMAEILQALPAPWTRSSVLAALQRRAPMDLGGYAISYEGRRRQGALVTQAMLTADARIVG
ncbi:ABC transporter substrate-binding protein [Acidovorax lacteus]|uniref:Leucine-binding protein domain-containing protein n=1 Tax=Acidovorax lacteus TaxID=1924988 RepID=A0ABP8L2Q7_9BURK